MLLNTIGILLSTLTLGTLWETHHWWIRIFDFPSLQIAVAMSLLLGLRLYLGTEHLWDLITIGLLVLSIAIDLYRIIPYTPLVSKEMPLLEAGDAEGVPFKLLSLNVRQKNTDYQRTLDCIERVDPDMVLLLETNGNWQQGMDDLRQTYQYKIEVPKENTYGMLLYSKFPIVDGEVRYLVDKNVPSVFLDIDLGGGKLLKVIGLHPRPPRPSEGSSVHRDGELAKVASYVRESVSGPVIVLGDLNDVAWSHTTRLFKRVSGLLDPRVGRGFYNTFPAISPVTLFPLDHTFVSSDLKLVSLEVLPSVGSDHLPILFNAKIAGKSSTTQDDSLRDGDLKNADRLIRKSKDWEPPKEPVED